MQPVSSTYCQNSVFAGKQHENAVFARKRGLDYYPFGMLMPGRHYTAGSSSLAYRYGMNGQEKDDEIYGNGNSYSAEFWQYDARIGRRWNIDPVVKPWESRYATFSNNPILFVDPNGDNAGIYKDEDGNVIGDDGKKDGKEYVVKTAKSQSDVYPESGGDRGNVNGITSERQQQVINTIKGGTEAGVDFSASVAGDVVELPSANLQRQMFQHANMVGADFEVGGLIAMAGSYNFIVPVIGGSSISQNLSGGSTVQLNFSSAAREASGMSIYQGLFSKYHVHPTGSGYIQAPSGTDIMNARKDAKVFKSINMYVISRQNERMYIYNSTGVIATMKYTPPPVTNNPNNSVVFTE